jgi:hypothetical protein
MFASGHLQTFSLMHPDVRSALESGHRSTLSDVGFVPLSDFDGLILDGWTT